MGCPRPAAPVGGQHSSAPQAIPPSILSSGPPEALWPSTSTPPRRPLLWLPPHTPQKRVKAHERVGVSLSPRGSGGGGGPQPRVGTADLSHCTREHGGRGGGRGRGGLEPTSLRGPLRQLSAVSRRPAWSDKPRSLGDGTHPLLRGPRQCAHTGRVTRLSGTPGTRGPLPAAFRGARRREGQPGHPRAALGASGDTSVLPLMLTGPPKGR